MLPYHSVTAKSLQSHASRHQPGQPEASGHEETRKPEYEATLTEQQDDVGRMLCGLLFVRK
jgi:hypothetical protein